jgi:SAM domain (Sterile alpha motif)/Adenylate and Guanylate cyclase catalytic domain
MDLGDWLRSLGLEEYETAFRQNHIDDAILPSLTAEDLKDLGIGSIGHRRKLIDAIALLRADATTKAPPPEAPSGLPKPAQDTAERRQVTVMFSDLVGSTALSARMDPEDLREVISAYQRCVAETVQRFGGSSQSTWATACWCISAIRRPTRTTPSGRYERGWGWLLP